MINIDGTEYMTAREAAGRLGLSVGTLRNQRSEGRSPMTYVIHFGRALYPATEVERYARELGRWPTTCGASPHAGCAPSSTTTRR